MSTCCYTPNCEILRSFPREPITCLYINLYHASAILGEISFSPHKNSPSNPPKPTQSKLPGGHPHSHFGQVFGRFENLTRTYECFIVFTRERSCQLCDRPICAHSSCISRPITANGILPTSGLMTAILAAS